MVAGNVLGGLVTGLVLLPAIGTESTMLGFGAVGALFGAGVRQVGGRPIPRAVRWVVVLAVVVLGAATFPRAGQLYAAIHVPPFEQATLRVREGRDAVVLTYERGERVRNFINGQGHGYRPGPVFFAEAIAALGVGPAAPRRVLVIGLGAGSIADAVLASPGVEQVTIVELCPSVVENLRDSLALAPIFRDSRVSVVVDDGRLFLQRAEGRFDAILMDPLRTTTAYSNNLHSREFFAMAAQHLAPGGVLMVGGVDETPVIPKTLMAEFQHVRWYAGYCLASRAPLSIDEARVERLLQALPPQISEAVVELSARSLAGDALVAATRGVPINEDWRPVSEYYLRPPFR
jgi:predicted membrane-bound spermidine synthase